MVSLEIRGAKFVKTLATGAAVIFTACSSGVGSKSDSLSISVEVRQKQMIQVIDGEAFIARFSEGTFLVGDNSGGLDPKDSIFQARDLMTERGCKIIDTQDTIGLNGEKTAELVKVSNPKNCLTELK